MKRIAILTTTVFLIAGLLGGCGFWMTGDYLSVVSHEANSEIDREAVVEVSSYAQLCNALLEMVNNCTESGIIYVTTFSEASVDYYVNSAINHVKNSTPIGAYAVENITYEIGIKRDASIVAFNIDYSHSRADILQMQHVRNNEELIDAVIEALKANESYVAIHTQSYQTVDFSQFVQKFANDNPDLVMETPKVGSIVYPQKGAERIVELSFTYLNDRDSLQEMQNRVSEVFTSAELYVKETTQVKDIYSRLYSFLMERDEYNLETSITPAYSLLQHGVGDSRALANVYAVMCRRAGLDCVVVSGTRDAEPWCWNLVRFRDKYYHVDLLRCSDNDEFAMRLKDEMSGYVWDYSAYPDS